MADKAAEAAARINAILASKGKLAKGNDTPAQAPGLPAPSTGEYLEKEIEINDVPNPIRYTLTKGQFHTELLQKYKVSVTTRGRFYSVTEKATFDRNNSDISAVATADRPLFLHCSAPSEKDMEAGVEQINKLIEESKQPKARPGRDDHGLMQRDRGYHQREIQRRLFVGVEVDPSYDIKEKITGPDGMYLQHIINSTGARVSLRGKGSGCRDPITGEESYEGLHLFVTHTHPRGMDQAVGLCESLLATVARDYNSHRAANPTPLYAATPYGAPIMPYGVDPTYGGPAHPPMPSPGPPLYGYGYAASPIPPAYPPLSGGPPIPPMGVAPSMAYPPYGAPEPPPVPYGYPPVTDPSTLPYGYVPPPTAPGYPGIAPPPPPPISQYQPSPPIGPPSSDGTSGKRHFKEAIEIIAPTKRTFEETIPQRVDANKPQPESGGRGEGPPNETRDKDGFVMPPPKKVRANGVTRGGLVDYGDDDE